MSFLAKSVLFNRPFKKGNAKVTLLRVVTTGNVQEMTSAALEDDVLRALIDLEGYHVKWMCGETCWDLWNLYSPALKYFKETLEYNSCTNVKSASSSRVQQGGRGCGSKHPDRARRISS